MNQLSTFSAMHSLNECRPILLPRVVKSRKRLSVFMSVFFVMIISFSGSSQNPISVENAKIGTPASVWDLPINPITGVADAGDPTLQGFPTAMSVNKGTTISFKIKSNVNYTMDIFRLGYYNGLGARLWGTGTVNNTISKTQPVDLYDPITGKTDCSNWKISGSWAVPSTAISGVYIAKLKRTDNGGSSHIIFIVRDDNSTANILCKTSDATWEAYNNYGGNSLYPHLFGVDNTIEVSGFDHATKVSYDRPLVIRDQPHNSFFYSEYPMVRWLERNGYNVSYTTCVDMSKPMPTILPSKHKVLISMGHDEYWSETMRANFENARNAGVHLAFFTANEMFWKTRWEDNFRTLVCYKEGSIGVSACGGKCDPLANEWTGLHRDGCEFSQVKACNPESLLTGQIGYVGAYTALQVPSSYKNLRFWRNTTIATMPANSTVSSTTPQFLGYEIDVEQQNNFPYPPGRITLSNTTTVSIFDGTVSGMLNHKLSLYRHSSGALVFGAGTIHYSWALDDKHDNPKNGLLNPVDKNLQQATVNLFADMGVQPYTRQSDLLPATISTDKTPPASVITAPAKDDILNVGKSVTILGTATDAGGGVVGGMEISVDGGATWKSAEGTSSWTYVWKPTIEGVFNIKTRSVDDNGNIETPSTGTSSTNSILVNVQSSACPCTVFQPTDVPTSPSAQQATPIELGVKFTTAQDGVIKGIRYYKSKVTSGLRSASLWTSNGERLGSVQAISEVIGWNELSFASPISINANTVYIASIFNPDGSFDETNPFFDQPLTNGPITAINGAYKFSPESVFPDVTYETSNYWVDVVYDSKGPVISKNPVSSSVCSGSLATFTAAAGSVGIFSVQWQQSVNGGASWNNILLAKAATLVFYASASDNNNQYRAVFTNSSGSTNTLPATLTVSAPIVVSASVSEADCTVSDGSITVSASGGISPLAYSLNGIEFQSSNIFNNLPGATYTITVKDAINCTSVITNVVVVQGGNLALQLINKTDAICGTNNGTITVEATCGSPSYRYIISGGTYLSSGKFTNLSPGTYTVWAVDANWNFAKISDIVISEISTIALTVTSKTDENCSNKDGSVTVIASGGKSTYSYRLNSGSYQSGSTFSNLSAGSYNITAKDANNCTTTIAVIIEKATSSLLIRITGSTNASCANNDGTITVAASGGKSPYLFSLNGGQYQTSGTFSKLAAGTYTLTVKDAYGCTNSKAGTITMTASTLSLKATSIINETCSNQDGSITVAASGGKSSYQYKLNSGSYQSGGTFNNLSAGTYSLTVKDANGCISTIAVTITSTSTLNLNLVNVDNVDCYNSKGSITVKGIGGNSPYKYRIGSDSYQSDNTFDKLKPGKYDITVRDAKYCTFSIKGIEVKDERTNCSNNSRGTAGLIEEVEVEPQVSIYPNPAMSDFKVLLKGYNGMTVTIRITGTLGKEVLKKQVVVTSQVLSVPIGLGKIAKGIYFVNVISDKKMTTDKLIVQ